MINKILKLLFGLALIASISVSCKRQKIYDPEYMKAKIPISIDWSKSQVVEGDINNVSVYFYPVEGGEPMVVYSKNPHFVLAQITEGRYNILIHNELAGNVKGLDCSDDNNFDGYTMTTQKRDTSELDMYYKPSADEQLIAESEAIATWSYRDFEVTKDMIEYTRTKSFDDFLTKMRSRATSGGEEKIPYPEFPDDDEDATLQTKAATKAVTKSLENLVDVPMAPLTTTYEVDIEIDNMNNIQYIEVVFAGFVDSANVESHKKEPASLMNYTHFQPRDYEFDEGSTTNGEMRYSFTNLGHHCKEGEQYNLTVNIILHSGSLFTKEVDITDQLLNHSDGVVIEIKIGDSFDNDTPTIVLPSYEGGGFGVGDWGNAENVIL